MFLPRGEVEHQVVTGYGLPGLRRVARVADVVDEAEWCYSGVEDAAANSSLRLALGVMPCRVLEPKRSYQFDSGHGHLASLPEAYAPLAVASVVHVPAPPAPRLYVSAEWMRDHFW